MAELKININKWKEIDNNLLMKEIAKQIVACANEKKFDNKLKHFVNDYCGTGTEYIIEYKP